MSNFFPLKAPPRSYPELKLAVRLDRPPDRPRYLRTPSKEWGSQRGARQVLPLLKRVLVPFNTLVPPPSPPTFCLPSFGDGAGFLNGERVRMSVLNGTSTRLRRGNTCAVSRPKTTKKLIIGVHFQPQNQSHKGRSLARSLPPSPQRFVV